MILKIIIVLLLLFILFNLGSGLFYLMKDRGQSTRTVKALTWRVGLSLVLFIVLMIAFAFGWIQPHMM